MKNIDYFNEYTAKIFAKLYQEFPRRCSIEISKITGKDNRNKKETELCTDTLYWLREHGYIIYDDKDKILDGDIVSCVLSDKGLAVLNQVPESLNAEQSYGDKLIDAVQNGALDSIKSTVSSLLSTGLKMAITSLS